MKTVLGVVIFLSLAILVVFFFGTKPVNHQDDQVEVNKEKPALQWENPPEMQIDTTRSYTAQIETSKGTIIKAQLFASEVPQTVNNFVFLTRQGFYDNVLFHRIIKDFMVQTGDPTGTGAGGPGYTFADEPITRDYLRGTLAMANRGPNTNGSQFFIVTQDNLDLPKQYTIFGAIDQEDTASLATLDAIANTPVEVNVAGEASQPTEAVKIISVVIEEN